MSDRKLPILRAYEERRPVYASLVEEVMFAAREALIAREIKVATVLGRTKEPTSLAEKIDRKKYEAMEDVPDLAGVRIVCMYSSQVEAVSAIVHDEFEVLEESDKLENLGADRMGYQGVHFLVGLGSSYSDRSLRGLRCEVQVRTVLQDAWALISHHLVYKNEESVPVRLRRDLNNVTSLLEIAQSVFDSVEEKRDRYLLEIKESTKVPDDFLLQSIDYDTLTAYSKWKFPHLAHSEFWQTKLLEDLDLRRYARLGNLDEAVEKAKDAVAVYREDKPDWFQYSTDFLTKSLGFVDLEFRRKHSFAAPTREAFERYRHLVRGNEGEAA